MNGWKSIGLILATSLGAAGENTLRFDDKSPHGSAWMDGANWRDQTAGDTKGRVPGPNDLVRFNFGGAAGILSSDAGTVMKLQIGTDDRGGRLTIEPGARLVVSDHENYIGWKADGVGGVLVMNGGLLNYKGWVCVANTGDGRLILNDGLIRVENVFFHDLREGGGRAITEIRGGLLDVNTMRLNSGSVDLSGGMIRVRASCTEAEVDEWIARGCLTFNGSASAEKGRDYHIKPWGTEKQGVEIRLGAAPKAMVLRGLDVERQRPPESAFRTIGLIDS